MKKHLVLSAVGALMLGLAPTAPAEPVVLVQGSASTPNSAERAYAASITRRLSRWLTELNLAHLTVTDENLNADALRGARVVVLGYNPFPTRSEQEVLKAFCAAGGKLIVFYGGDPAFAAWMGLKMGPVLSPVRNGNWHRIRFTADAPRYTPVAVEQNSRVIRAVFPNGSGQVIATWEREDGTGSGDPGIWIG